MTSVPRFSTPDSVATAPLSNLRVARNPFQFRATTAGLVLAEWPAVSAEHILEKRHQNGPLPVSELQLTGAGVFAKRYSHAFLLTADSDVYFVRSPGAGSVWQGIYLGRDEDACDIVIDHPRISRKHAVFERDPNTGGYILVDNHSRNGTRIERLKLSPGRGRALCSGMHIDFGGVAFQFLSSADMFLTVFGGRHASHQ